MSTEIQHSCIFCRAKLTLRIADGATELFSLDWWKAHGACNRCADFHSRRLTLEGNIYFHAMRARVRDTRTDEAEYPDPDAKSGQSNEGYKATLESVRRRLTYLTKCFAKRVCDFESRVINWEPDFVDMIMQHPAQVKVILDGYFRDHAPSTFKRWQAARATQPARTP